MPTIEVTYKKKRAATQIKKIASDRSASIFDSDKSVKIPRKKKARTVILRSNKTSQKKGHNHHGTQHYYVLCKKAGIPEINYMSHNA